jgi:hypothetical protein
MEMTVTPLESIRLASLGNLVEIPGFTDDAPLMFRLRKPNMLTLMKLGRIPNTLIESATGLFNGGKKDRKDGYTSKELEEIAELMTIFCEASLASPTWKELMEAGIELTQEQMMFIFHYSQGGIKTLKPFRGEQENRANSGDGNEISVPTEHSA